jgi:hypothetical protein
MPRFSPTLGAEMHCQVIRSLLIVCAVIIHKPSSSIAQEFTADIELRCRDAKTHDAKHSCEVRCFALGTSAADKFLFSYNFERLQFYSEAGRNSEHWLVALTGRQGPDPVLTPPPTTIAPPGTPPPPLVPPPPIPAPFTLDKIFLTLGRNYFCQYAPASGSEVKLVKYYDRPSSK